jgi:hypothetical protein
MRLTGLGCHTPYCQVKMGKSSLVGELLEMQDPQPTSCRVGTDHQELNSAPLGQGIAPISVKYCGHFAGPGQWSNLG